MTNSASLGKTIEENFSLSDEDVAEYLRNNPNFFMSHKEILADLHVHHQSQGIVSLTQIQLEQYREKVKQQKKQLESMVANAKRNELIYTTYADLNLAISKCQSLAELESVLNEHLCGVLNMTEVNLLMLNDASQKLPELPQKSLLEKKLHNRAYYFGRLSLHEKQMLFSQEEIGSVTLMRIGQEPVIAVLAIASLDPLHFTPDMDTTLLQYLHDFLSFHLQRIMGEA